MKKGKPRQARVPAILTLLLEAVDRRVFRDPDIDATVRGWQVRRSRRFHRIYRDPRWDLVSVCGACGGAGSVGARTCPDCGGDGRIIAGPAESVGVS
jgi:hypothetical protein